MPLDPDSKPREFLIVLIAAGVFIFKSVGPKEAFDKATEFVAEAEKLIGPIKP